MHKKRIKALLLAAGFGSRLKPYTDFWPKCLMPIDDIPLLEYWLFYLDKANVRDVLINTHYKKDIVLDFLARKHLSWVNSVNEDVLLGTAGTLINNYNFFVGHPILLIHADNWTNEFLDDFIDYHINFRPKNCLITMMLFHTETPQFCGIVELNHKNIVINFHEKKNDSIYGNLANAAVYILEPEVLDWVFERPWINDFSSEVIPNFLGRISTWTTKGVFRDIGSINSLKIAQFDSKPFFTSIRDSWSDEFKKNIVSKFNLKET